MPFPSVLNATFRLLRKLFSRPIKLSDDEIIKSIPELDIDCDCWQTTAFIQNTTNAILISEYLANRHDSPMFQDQYDQLEWIVRYPNDSLYVLVETLPLFYSN